MCQFQKHIISENTTSSQNSATLQFGLQTIQINTLTSLHRTQKNCKAIRIKGITLSEISRRSFCNFYSPISHLCRSGDFPQENLHPLHTLQFFDHQSCTEIRHTDSNDEYGVFFMNDVKQCQLIYLDFFLQGFGDIIPNQRILHCFTKSIKVN